MFLGFDGVFIANDRRGKDEAKVRIGDWDLPEEAGYASRNIEWF